MKSITDVDKTKLCDADADHEALYGIAKYMDDVPVNINVTVIVLLEEAASAPGNPSKDSTTAIGVPPDESLTSIVYDCDLTPVPPDAVTPIEIFIAPKYVFAASKPVKAADVPDPVNDRIGKSPKLVKDPEYNSNGYTVPAARFDETVLKIPGFVKYICEPGREDETMAAEIDLIFPSPPTSTLEGL